VTIALRIDPEDQTVDPGRPAVFTIHVVNQSGIVDRVALDILGSAGEWSQVEPQAVALFPGTDGTSILTIIPPLGTPLGQVPLGVRATAETSGWIEVGEATLNVGASRTVEAELRPRTATGKRRATSVIVLHNLGNAPTKVSVVATDPDDAIVFDAPSAVQIGPGLTAELPLRMRLPSREKQGATLPYSVLVEGGDTGQSLDGQVRQPAKKRWPIMAAMMVLALLAAAFVLFKPQDAVAIKEGQADEVTTSTVAAVTTVPGATTVAGAPVDPAATGPAGAVTTAKPGGAATTVAGPAATQRTVATVVNPGVVVPTTATTVARAPLPCPAKGDAKATAQRVICAWELKRLGEVSDSTTPEAVAALGKLAAIGGQLVTAVEGERVSFGGCVPGKGVASVTVPATTPSFAAGRVLGVTPCPTAAAGALTS
jgi:hypothetical protein